MADYPRIETLAPKKLVGKSLRMTLAADRTAELWRSFMPERGRITNTLATIGSADTTNRSADTTIGSAETTDLISMQVYEPGFDFKDFTPATEFTKWAAVEVADHDAVPAGLEAYTLSGGLYAVFLHRGPPAAFPATFQFIFREWLPEAGYAVDRREHFELLGEKYKHNQPDSEEEIWVPVRKSP